MIFDFIYEVPLCIMITFCMEIGKNALLCRLSNTYVLIMASYTLFYFHTYTQCLAINKLCILPWLNSTYKLVILFAGSPGLNYWWFASVLTKFTLILIFFCRNALRYGYNDTALFFCVWVSVRPSVCPSIRNLLDSIKRLKKCILRQNLHKCHSLW